MELIDYLNRHFLTRAQLLAASGITSARLDELLAGGLMPRASRTNGATSWPAPTGCARVPGCQKTSPPRSWRSA